VPSPPGRPGCIGDGQRVRRCSVGGVTVAHRHCSIDLAAGSVTYRLMFDGHRIADCPVIGRMAFNSEL
jgi:hypothetical protein